MWTLYRVLQNVVSSENPVHRYTLSIVPFTWRRTCPVLCGGAEIKNKGMNWTAASSPVGTLSYNFIFVLKGARWVMSTCTVVCSVAIF